MEKQEKEKKIDFNEKIRPVLTMIGTIGAALMIFAYIVIVCIMVFGFSVANFTQSILFAIVNAVIGLIILQFLKIQGIDLAKQIPDNQKVLKEYYELKPKDKKTHSIKYFWITSVIKDIFTKVLTIAATSAGLIYIVIVGSKDYTLFLLAIVNLIMFVCFGLITLVSAYDFFNEKHIPFLRERLEEIENEAKIKESMEVVTTEPTQPRNDCVHSDRRTDLLEPSMGDSNISADNRPVVVDSDDCGDCVLGGTVYPSSDITDRTDNGVEENISKNSEEKEC